MSRFDFSENYTSITYCDESALTLITSYVCFDEKYGLNTSIKHPTVATKFFFFTRNIK